MRFSVVILASRPRSLVRCLESLVAASPAAGSECLVALHGSHDACAAAAAPFAGRLPGLRLLRGEARNLGGGRNGALAEASGDWVCFLDDDVAVPPDYFSTLGAKIAAYPGASAIGGPNLTPPGSSLFERCVGLTLGSAWGAGPMRRRYSGFEEDSWTGDAGLILCNLCLRREHLEDEGLRFDEELVRNEENLLLERLFRSGRRALHAPGLFVLHERRSTWAGFCRQCFLSGRGRAEMTWKLPGSLRPIHLAPLLLAALAAGLAARSAAFLAPLLAYAAASAFSAGLVASRSAEGLRGLAWLVLLAPSGHASYAAGLLAGFVAGVARRAETAGGAAPAPAHVP